MNNIQQSFVKNLALLTVFMYLLGGALFTTFLKSYYLHVFLVLPVFNFVINVFAYSAVSKRISLSQVQFNNAFMISTMVKLLIYIAGLLAYVLYNKQSAFVFTLVYMGLYFVYTFYEARALVVYVNKQKSANTAAKTE